MTGPKITILLRKISEKDKQRLDEYLTDMSEIKQKANNQYEIASYHKKIKAKQYFNKLRDLSIVVNEFRHSIEDNMDNNSWIKKIGYVNHFSIDITALKSEEIDHEVLFGIAMDLAEHFDGMLYLHGILLDNEAEDNLAKAMSYSQTNEGVCHFSIYEKAEGSQWANQIVDVEYLKNWMLKHKFKIVKR